MRVSTFLCIAAIVVQSTSALAWRVSMSVAPQTNSVRARQGLISTVQNFGAIAAIATSARPARAKTFFDTDVYGDKELKIATVNKLKQKLRNAILQDNSVAPNLLKLAINDALGYDMISEDGGPDGSIQFEMDKEENKGLANALAVVLDVKKQMQRTNTLSFADVCAFAGAEALETIGCGRIAVQVGRFDAKSANTKSPVVPWNNPSPAAVVEAFRTSGLQPSDVALLIGGLGEVNRIVAETKKANDEAKEEEDEDDAEFEAQPFVPTTFGARDAIYGAKMGKGDFGSGFIKAALKGKLSGAENFALGAVLVDDPKVKASATKYGSNELAFKQEIAEVYVKLTQLGEAYTTRNS